MKRAILAAAMLFGTALTAHAQINDTWNDIREPWRSNAEMQSLLQVDVRICNREAGVQRGPLTAKFKTCMLRHDWKFSHSTRTKSRPAVGRDDEPVAVDTSSDDTHRRVQDQNNLQQMLNTQQVINDQQRQNDEQFNQNQQQMIQQMNQ